MAFEKCANCIWVRQSFPGKPFRGIPNGNTRAPICALFEEPNKNFKAQTKEQ